MLRCVSMYKYGVVVAVAFLTVLGLCLSLPSIIVKRGVMLRPEEIVLEINIPPEVSKGFDKYANVGELIVNKEYAWILVKAEGEVLGDLKVAVNPIVYIGDEKIPMPCAFYNTKTCVRVMVLIPGYDVPLKITKGKYPVSIEVNWVKETGTGTLKVKFKVIESENPSPST